MKSRSLALSRPAPREILGPRLVAIVSNDKGLHFRWRGGRGGYNWYPRSVDARFADAVLTVPLAPRGVHVPERRRGGAWLGEILRELGYVM